MKLLGRMRFKKNVGPREQRLRTGLGIVMLLGALSPRFARWRWLLLPLGVANVLTARTGYCPSNALAGVDNTKGHELIHFQRSRPWGRRLNRLQRRWGATV